MGVNEATRAPVAESRAPFVSVAWLIAAITVGCTPMRAYRTETAKVCESDVLAKQCGQAAVQSYRNAHDPDGGFDLGVVELDDQGQLHKPAQREALLDRIAADAVDHELMMVVFVHGWKHDAHEGDDNLDHFKEALRSLSQREAEFSHSRGILRRTVVGVYVGWRGLSVTPPVLKEFSFWDRKNTAQKVGHGEVTEILEGLEMVRLEKNRETQEAPNPTRLVVVGHSFGGAMVYSALAQILADGFIKSTGSPSVSADARGFGDLVVLINPAFEAQQFAPLDDLAVSRASYFKNQLPVLAILTSEADQATGKAFPLGRWFSTRFEKGRVVERTNPVTHQTERIDQREANVAAVGHFEPFRTHYLRATGGTDCAAAAVRANAEARVQSIESAALAWEGDAPGSHIPFPCSMLERTDNSVARNPYLVVRVDRHIIPDHNAIWDDRVEAFLSHLILVASQVSNPRARTEQRGRSLKGAVSGSGGR